MGAHLDLWDVSDGHLKAREELERLNNIEVAMEEIRDLTIACNGGLLQNIHAIAQLALDPDGCKDLARIKDA